jgi:hypothetical protein
MARVCGGTDLKVCAEWEEGEKRRRRREKNDFLLFFVIFFFLLCHRVLARVAVDVLVALGVT